MKKNRNGGIRILSNDNETCLLEDDMDNSNIYETIFKEKDIKKIKRLLKINKRRVV